jgi:hypothetical protein
LFIAMLLQRLLILCIVVPFSAVQAREYEVPVNDVAGFFAKLPEDATLVRFCAAALYRCETDIVLPARQLLIIDGCGARLTLGAGSNGFTTRVADQKAALVHTASRYTIRDFAAIEGGRKAIDLKATLNSTITNCRFTGQTEAAIDLRFCLMARIQNVLVTNPRDKGIVLRQGDWPGATATNSQSNSSVLEQCRVYCTATTTAAFTILNSGGVRLQDCISEGAAPQYDVFLSARMDGDEERTANNPVVKSFHASNLHVEHSCRTASLHINMPNKAVVDLQNIYWNGKQTAPVIRYMNGQVNLHDIGWWDASFHIATRVSAPRLHVERCPSALFITSDKNASPVQAGVLRLADPLEGNSELSLGQVRVLHPTR